jgi:hypothetical protein
MAFVLSNDQFQEFPEKAAKRYGRVIRHEIVTGRVIVHDLNIDVEFGNQAR